MLTVQSPGGALAEVRSDLFIRRRGGEELYFEIKTPDPNKGQCKTMKRDMLTIAALRKGHRAEAYAACAYNPGGDDAAFRNNFVAQFLEIPADIIVGRAFWELIGESGTYDELLEIAAEVGGSVRPLLPH